MDVEVKPPPLENGSNVEETLKTPPAAAAEEDTVELSKPVVRQKHKRSRSRTPGHIDDNKTLQITLTKLNEDANAKNAKENERETEKKPIDANGETENGTNEGEPITKRTRHKKELTVQQQKDNEKTPSPKKGESPKKSTSKNGGSPKKNTSKNETTESESIEMEPLVISDEHEPELQFDELSDKESGKGSPVIPRCVTRRSLTRNIPTPKTPKSIELEIESEQASTTTEQTEAEESLRNDDDTNESTVSTKAEVGSDVTRLEYVEKSTLLLGDDSHLNEYRERSLTETIRCLSARKPIRDVYRNKTFRVQEKSDLDAPFHNRDSVEITSSGIKRKNRSITPEETKKFKSDTSNFFTSPLASLRDKFRSDAVASSTPLLRRYADSRTDLHYDESQGHTVENGMDDKKSWCLLM